MTTESDEFPRMCGVSNRRYVVKHPDYPCPTDGCPGDARYVPPGRGHKVGCDNLRYPPVRESCSCPDPLRAVDALCPLHGHSPERRYSPGQEVDQ